MSGTRHRYTVYILLINHVIFFCRDIISDMIFSTCEIVLLLTTLSMHSLRNAKCPQAELKRCYNICIYIYVFKRLILCIHLSMYTRVCVCRVCGVYDVWHSLNRCLQFYLYTPSEKKHSLRDKYTFRRFYNGLHVTVVQFEKRFFAPKDAIVAQ